MLYDSELAVNFISSVNIFLVVGVSALGADTWVRGKVVVIQGAQSRRGLTGITDIYCFRAPCETFVRGPQNAPRIHHSGEQHLPVE